MATTEANNFSLPDGFWYVGQYNSTGYKYAIVIGEEQLRFINKHDFQSVDQFLKACGIQFEVYERRYVESWVIKKQS